MLLIILIPIAWLALVGLFVALCRVAADSDGRAATVTADEAGTLIRSGLVVFEHADALAVQGAAQRPGSPQHPVRAPSTARARRRRGVAASGIS